jgi:hypothetical protein
MNKHTFPLILFVLLSCSSGFAQKGDAFKWLIATWKINTGKGYVVESWVQSNDSTFIGKSVFVKAANDTIPQEHLELRLRNGGWSYVSTVQGQNKNQPVAFKVIFLGRSEFICENPAHDFPQRIAYRRFKDQLFASIEGNKKGKYAKSNFDFSIE